MRILTVRIVHRFPLLTQKDSSHYLSALHGHLLRPVCYQAVHSII